MGRILDVGLALLALICTMGVFSHKFDDRLFQRIGLCLTAAGCVLLVYARVNEYGVVAETRLRVIGLTGVLTFAIATAIKIWRRK